MPARNEILSALRRQLPQVSDAPRPTLNATTYPDAVSHFSKVLEAVGGRAIRVASLREIEQHLQQLPAYASAQKRCSGIPDVGNPNVNHEQITDPHALNDVDFSLLPGELAVAENGAVWVATNSLNVRTLLFLSQHVALVVPTARVLSNMHEAYESISVGATRFGTFISGPSKTADIEQSLVIGAHGSRSMTLFLVDAMPASME